MFLSLLFWSFIGYLLGSCPTGFLVTKIIASSDIRAFGSGNIGATNVGRLLGKKWAVFVAVFDMLKGGIAVLIASIFTIDSNILAITGFFAVLGHNFPVWLKFKGGKGVATTFGVLGFYDFFNPISAIIGGCVWFVVMKTTKYVSVASMVGLFASAFCTRLFDMPIPYTISAFALACLSVWRHRTNISRIKTGTESKVKC
ncbi:MAG: glycerol-3-phosphate 1-O-acyltransferase PlsY [Synergistaceae bacterium]